MSEHKVNLRWERGGAEFVYQKYPRDHTWSFDGGHDHDGYGGARLFGQSANVDPEEAFVASLSSCHMLTFLAIACKKKFVLDEYTDEAVGHMEKNAEGKLAITRVELHPKLKLSGDKKPTEEELEEMHHFAHDRMFHREFGQNRGHGREINTLGGTTAVSSHQDLGRDGARPSIRMNPKTDPQRMEKIVSLCKRRGFIFQSSEIYGGLNGVWDYGPLGTELKNNLKQYWWRVMVRERDDVVGLDGSILTHRAVLKASGHEDTFSDPMVDCRTCKAGCAPISLPEKNGTKQCPNCGGKDLN